MDRRDFIRKTLLAAGGLMSARVFGAGTPPTAAGKTTKGKTEMDYVTLNNGVRMPVLGYGTLRLSPDACADCVAKAVEAGYRLIDTAKNYANETHVGEGIRRSGIAREELFITSKLWIKDYGYEQAKQAFQATLDRLRLDYLDLYLLHQPFGDVYGAWRALEELYAEGKIRAVGISNFFPDRVVDFAYTARVKPAVNQIEFNPYFQRWADKRVNDEYGVQVESWSPLVSGLRPEVLAEPVLAEIGKKYGKTPAQAILRWLTQQGVVTICKTQRPERMKENLESLSFKLSVEDIARIVALDTGRTAAKDHRSPEDVKWFHTQATRDLG